MERYKLNELFNTSSQFALLMRTAILKHTPLLMGTDATLQSELIGFISSCIYGYFYDDLVAYAGNSVSEVSPIFLDRLGYDLAIKYAYWSRKYNEVKKLLTAEDLSMMQTSKVTSSSTDETRSAGGSLQKGATTPTGVSATTNPDEINITITPDDGEVENSIDTNGFVDKYSNHQQKFVNANKVEGERSGTILREGSIKELTEVLEKLPSSFADEVTKQVAKHFIFDYEGEERGYYNE